MGIGIVVSQNLIQGTLVGIAQRQPCTEVDPAAGVNLYSARSTNIVPQVGWQRALRW
jgi:hypothetical protein